QKSPCPFFKQYSVDISRSLRYIYPTPQCRDFRQYPVGFLNISPYYLLFEQYSVCNTDNLSYTVQALQCLSFRQYPIHISCTSPRKLSTRRGYFFTYSLLCSRRYFNFSQSQARSVWALGGASVLLRAT